MPEITYQVELSARERYVLVLIAEHWNPKDFEGHAYPPTVAEVDALIARLS